MQMCLRVVSMPGLEIGAPSATSVKLLHCILYCQETFSLGGPGLCKLGRAVIAVVMNITVCLRFYACCIICFTNLSWADWISLSFFFNIRKIVKLEK